MAFLKRKIKVECVCDNIRLHIGDTFHDLSVTAAEGMIKALHSAIADHKRRREIEAHGY